MKRVNLTTVDRPQVDADCAGHVAQSTVIVNAKKNPNFANPVAYFDVVCILLFTYVIVDIITVGGVKLKCIHFMYFRILQALGSSVK